MKDSCSTAIFEDDSTEELRALTHQMHALKDLLAKSREEGKRFKHQFEMLQLTLAEKEASIRQLHEFKILHQRGQEQIQQLQQELREAESDSSDELKRLFEQISALKITVKKQDQETLALRQRMEESLLQMCRSHEEKEAACGRYELQYSQLVAAQLENENLRQLMDQALQERRDAEARYHTLAKDKTDLLDQAERSRQQVLDLNHGMRLKDDQIAEWERAAQRHKQQLGTLEQQLNEAQRQQCHLQMALTDLRRDRESLLRAKAVMESDYKRSQQEKLELEAKLQQSHEEKAKRAAEIQQFIDKAQQEQKQRQALELEINTLRADLQQLNAEWQRTREALFVAEAQQKKLVADLQTRDHTIETLTTQMAFARQEKEHAEEELHKVRHTLEVRDGELQTAQQHLAKKVKESARIADRIEEYASRIHDLEKRSQEMQASYAQVEAELEKARKREKDIEERCEQRIVEATATASRWEAEHARIHAQWQQAEEANKKLKALEAKYNQMSSLLANLGQFFETPAAPPTPPPAAIIETHVSAPPAMIEQDLFATPQPQKRAKRNLFE